MGFMSTQTKSVKMSRVDLAPLLKVEVAKWSAKTIQDLRQELRKGAFTNALSKEHHHVEVAMLEDHDDYIHVMVSVCHPGAPWSCIHPLSKGFLVYSDGRVEK
jgi:hypothetical protein